MIATWYYEQDVSEGGIYPGAGTKPASRRFRDVYRRCVAVFFTTARSAVPEADLVLVLNRPWDRTASATAERTWRLLEELDVSIHVVQYTFSPPATWRENFRNQFFVFDALAEICAVAADDDGVVLLDSDMVWTGSPQTQQMWATLQSESAIAYFPFDDDPTRPISLLTTHQLRAIGHDLDPQLATSRLRYCGGEFIALRGDCCRQVIEAARRVWPKLLDRAAAGLPVFHEEAHLLSFLYAQLQVPLGTGDRYIRRIFTLPWSEHDAEPADRDLALWHVPAEKQYGLRRLYDRLDQLQDPARREQWFATAQRALGIPRKSPSYLARDLARRAGILMTQRQIGHGRQLRIRSNTS